MVDGIHPWVAENRERVGFGVSLLASSEWADLKERAQAAEELGFDSVWLPDHPLLGWDSWTMLAALAEATKRVRLGTMVSCVYYRHPLQLARVVADVDRISGGRAILGIGSGDMPWEFEQMGLGYPPPGERAAALEETLQFIPALLHGEEVHFEGERFRIAGARLVPPAPQQPRVPILVAGGGAKTTLRLTALYADAHNMAAATWAGGAFTPEDVTAKFATLRARCEDAGRPFDSILRTTQVGFHLVENEAQGRAMREAMEQDPKLRPILEFMQQVVHFATPAQAIETLRGLRRAGFQYFGGAASSVASMRRFASEVIPAVAEEQPETARA